jgi:hypothetical protein
VGTQLHITSKKFEMCRLKIEFIKLLFSLQLFNSRPALHMTRNNGKVNPAGVKIETLHLHATVYLLLGHSVYRFLNVLCRVH